MPNSIAGLRILVVEDEYFIAGDLRQALSDAGAKVIGPAPNLARASSVLDESSVDFAILDVNLEGEDSFPIADRLRAQDIKFMFVTGYDDWAIPDEYRDVPRMTKPYDIRTLTAYVGKLATSGSTTAPS